MFKALALAITIAVFLYVGYLLLRAYRPKWFSSRRIEPFVQKPMGPPTPSKVNMAPPPVPAPAPPITQPPPEEERTVAPGGPGAPNAAAPPAPPTISPEAKPVDPYDDKNMEAPIKDSMRLPELSFGPGVENTGVNRGTASGVTSTRSLTSESPFSPDFAQNGGVFMGSVSANDLSHDDTYAVA